MVVVKTQKKVVASPRKATAKKKKAKKGSIDALDHAIEIMHKHQLDFSYLKK